MSAAPSSSQAREVERLQKRGGSVGVRAELGGGAEIERFEALAGALGVDVEGADALDLGAEELDARGRVGLRREDVDDAAAARRLARRLDEGHDLEAGGLEAAQEVLGPSRSPTAMK